MAKQSILPDKVREQINKDLKTARELQEQIQLGKQALIPDMDVLESRCNHCINRMEAIKAAYFKGKP